MSIVEKIKQLLGQHPDKAKRGIGKAADMIDKKTGGKYSDKIDTAEKKATEYTDKLRDRPDDRPDDRPR